MLLRVARAAEALSAPVISEESTFDVEKDESSRCYVATGMVGSGGG